MKHIDINGRHLESPQPEPIDTTHLDHTDYISIKTNWVMIGALVLFICGLIAFLGIFLPWIGGSVDLFGVIFSADVSGWDGISLAGVEEVPQILLVIIGAGLMVLFGLPALMLAISSENLRKSVRYLLFIASMATLVVIGGVLWFIIEGINEDYLVFVRFGAYLSGGAALIGFIFGITAYLQSQYRVVNFKKVHSV